MSAPAEAIGDSATPPARPRRPRFWLSPINQRRWANFKANRRGYWSFWIFLVLFVASLFAEFIANDKPLVVTYNGGVYFPVFKSYPETAFGGEFETETDYRDPYLKDQITAAGGTIIWPLIPYSYETIRRDLPSPAPSPPTVENWLGTDDVGRDVTARVIYGFRISILFGLALTILSSAIGVVAGAVQGYFGGLVDLLTQRFIEIWSSLPSLFILIIIAAVLPRGFWILLGILLLFSWTSLVGLVRAEFLRGRNLEYVRAAKALGLGDWQVMFKHILPNAMVSTITFLPFITSSSVTALTALDFLGLGLPIGSASLGELLSQGRKHNLTAPWLGITAFVVVSVMLSLLVFIGEAVRDALDPRKTYR